MHYMYYRPIALILTVNCTSFIIFLLLCVTLKLFSLSFVPLVAPNPGDATESERSSTLVTDYANVGADDDIM